MQPESTLQPFYTPPVRPYDNSRPLIVVGSALLTLGFFLPWVSLPNLPFMDMMPTINGLWAIGMGGSSVGGTLLTLYTVMLLVCSLAVLVRALQRRNAVPTTALLVAGATQIPLLGLAVLFVLSGVLSGLDGMASMLNGLWGVGMGAIAMWIGTVLVWIPVIKSALRTAGVGNRARFWVLAVAGGVVMAGGIIVGIRIGGETLPVLLFVGCVVAVTVAVLLADRRMGGYSHGRQLFLAIATGALGGLFLAVAMLLSEGDDIKKLSHVAGIVPAIVLAVAQLAVLAGAAVGMTGRRPLADEAGDERAFGDGAPPPPATDAANGGAVPASA